MNVHTKYAILKSFLQKFLTFDKPLYQGTGRVTPMIIPRPRFSPEEVYWREIEEFPGYSVSDTGLVRNDQTGLLLGRTLNGSGVAYVNMTRDRVHHNRAIARLVAEAFLPPPKFTTFDTPINLDGDRTRLEVTNLMWRPRWFAVKYHQQFKKIWSSSDAVVDIETEKRFKTSMEAAMTYGLLALDIFEWCLQYNYYLEQNVPGVWPTDQRFRFVHTKSRPNRRI